MPIYTDTFDQTYKRFRQWLTDQANKGDFVTDLALDYLNRANQTLWSRTEWDDLIVRTPLTLSGLNANFPSDFGRVISVYHDSDGDGKPDWWYYRDGRYGAGYKQTRTFSKSTGSVFTIEFFTAPTSQPVLVYQKRLDDFTGEGTEYLFWPAELLLKEAQAIYKEDSDDLGGDYDKLVVRRDKLLLDFQAGHQFTNSDSRFELKDSDGERIVNDEVNLIDGGVPEYNRYDNSRDTGGLL